MKFLADENFNNNILRGVWRRTLDVSFTCVLEYAAEQGYVVLLHDVNTMRGYFYDRITNQFRPQGAETFHRRIVIRVAFATHAHLNAVVLQQCQVIIGHVLAATILWPFSPS